MFYLPTILGDNVPTRNANRHAELVSAFKEAEVDLQQAIHTLAEFRRLLTADPVFGQELERHHVSSLASNTGSTITSAQRRVQEAQEELLRALALASGFETDES